ncbi:MAG: sulfotransferase [Pseudomonadota bacterium]
MSRSPVLEAFLDLKSIRPIVLCGSLRAGTTLTRLLIGQHSQVSGHGESDFLFDGAPETSTDPNIVEAFCEKVAVRRSARFLGFRKPQGATYEEVLADLLHQHDAPEGTRLLFTVHRHVDRVARMFPNAFFVHLVRDPRDVALSAVAMGWGGVAYYGVDVWMEAERDWRAALPLIDQARRIEIRYEDLINDPHAVLSAVLEKAGLPFEESVLTPPESSTYSAPKPRAREGFRRQLSDREIAEINAKVASAGLTDVYDLEPQSAPSPRRLKELWFRRKLASMQFKLRRYGPGVVAGEALARTFSLQAISKRIDERKEVINVRYLK